MGIFDRFTHALNDPRTQALLGPLAMAFGAPQDQFGAALGRAGMMYQDRLADWEAQRLQDERFRHQVEREDEDRALRKKQMEQMEADRAFDREQAKQKVMDRANAKLRLEGQLREYGLPEELATTAPDVAQELVKKLLMDTVDPEDPDDWTNMGKGRVFRTNPYTHEPEFRADPGYVPDVDEPDKPKVSPGTRKLLRSKDFSDEEIDYLGDSGTLDNALSRVRPELVKETGGGSSTAPTVAGAFSDLNELVNNQNSPWYNDPEGALKELRRRHDMLAGSGLVPGMPTPAPTPTPEPNWQRWMRENPGAGRKGKVQPQGPDPTDEYLLDEDGSLIASAATPSSTPTPRQIEQERGGYKKTDPALLAGKEVGGAVVPDPALTPPGDAKLGTTVHSGPRIPRAEATPVAGLKNTLDTARARLSGKEYMGLLRAIEEDRAAGKSEQQIEQEIAAWLNAAR